MQTRPSRISIARLSVSLRSHAAGPPSTVSTNGSRASLFSQVAEFQRYDGLWSTAYYWTRAPTVNIGSSNVVGTAHENPMPSSHETSTTRLPLRKLATSSACR